MNAVIWTRVSSREQQEGYSIVAQLRMTREHAAREGWHVVREFAVAESARRGAERVAFNEMVKWVRLNATRQEIGVILSHKLDRICRNIRDAVRLQELERTHGVGLAFLDATFGPGAAGMLSFNVMAAVAQYYSDNLRTEVLKGKDERVRQGWPPNGVPYGYYNDRSDKERPVKPCPDKAASVVRAFELYSSGEFTLDGLGEELRREGRVYRPECPVFGRTCLSRILNNPFYIGQMRYRGSLVKGRYEPIIDLPTFQRCQDILQGKGRSRRQAKLPYGGGLLRCGLCGSPMSPELIRRRLRRGGVNEHRYYRCAGIAKPRHTALRWKEQDLESAIEKQLTAMVPSQDVLAHLRDVLPMAFGDVLGRRQRQRQLLAQRRGELAGMRNRLLNAHLVGAVEQATFTKKDEALKVELEANETAIREADEWERLHGHQAICAFDLGRSLLGRWRTANTQGRRKMLECLSIERILTKTSLVLVKRPPFGNMAERFGQAEL